jgi:YrbI family 3-deoxy-D-manno-octulosonate 8-phosphate phosphatase
MRNKKILLSDIDALIFDFDGVLTDNLVYLNQDGGEWVSCSRADGLAFDVLRKLKKPTYIISTEKNPIVTVRANKLKIPVIQGVENKFDALLELTENFGYSISRILYVGNDLNDYQVMKLCGHTACPADSHVKIKEVSDIILNTCGGKGVVRELLEDAFKLDFVEILYKK